MERGSKRTIASVFATCLASLATAQAGASNIERGRAIAAAAGCAGCHTIPGVRPDGGNIGPPLADIGRRVYIAGHLPNTIANMVVWVTQTQVIKPWDAMPSTDLSADEAADLAAFLQTLR